MAIAVGVCAGVGIVVLLVLLLLRHRARAKKVTEKPITEEPEVIEGTEKRSIASDTRIQGTESC